MITDPPQTDVGGHRPAEKPELRSSPGSSRGQRDSDPQAESLRISPPGRTSSRGSYHELISRLKQWGRLPVPPSEPTTLAERERRGRVTLAASVRLARQQRRLRIKRLAWALPAAALALVVVGRQVPHGPWGIPGASDEATAASSTANSAADSPSVSPENTGDVKGSGSASLRHSQTPHRKASGGRAEVLSGELMLKRGQGSWKLQPGATSTSLAPGDVLTAKHHRASIAIGGVTRVDLSPKATVTLETASKRRQRLVLADGEATFDVDPDRQASVTVEAGETQVHVTGTSFTIRTGRLSHSPKELPGLWTEVSVLQGQVEVEHDGQRVSLGPDDFWSSSTDASKAPHSTADAPPAGHHVSPSTPNPSLDHAAQPPQKGQHEKPSGSEGPTTLAQQNRLFQAALSARNRGDGRRCVQILARLTRTYPTSPLRQEALVARFRCLQSTGNSLAASRAAARYLAAYPNGFAREEARSLVLSPRK